jgi:predicted membrane channel-forming protein YqfA (hemolysin III family)
MNIINNIYFESIIIGIITLIIGNIIFYFFYDEKDKKKQNKTKNNLILFFIGVILHFIIIYTGFEKWYCNKECCKVLVGISS